MAQPVEGPYAARARPGGRIHPLTDADLLPLHRDGLGDLLGDHLLARAGAAALSLAQLALGSGPASWACVGWPTGSPAGGCWLA